MSNPMSDSTARAERIDALIRYCKIDPENYVGVGVIRKRDLAEMLGASRTSTIKELSGEGARESVQDLRDRLLDELPSFTPHATSYAKMDALIEAWGEEKTRALREDADALRLSLKQEREFWKSEREVSNRLRSHLVWALSHVEQLVPNWENDYDEDYTDGRLGSASENAINRLAEAQAALKDSTPLTVEEKIGPRWAEGGEDYMPEDTIAAVAFTHGWIMRGETDRGDHGAAEYLEKAWDRAYDELVALFPSPIRALTVEEKPL